jgi:superfamily I DNA/RNA helicase
MIEHALRDFPQAPGNPAAIYYDEAQDGSALELALLKQWAASTAHTRVVGDDFQAIYLWRGASVQDFLAFSPPEKRTVLAQSYRLPRAVHAVSQAWASHIRIGQFKEYAPRDADGLVVFRRLPLRLPDSWISEVAERAEHQSVMLLATCRYMLDRTVAVLKARGIPFHNPYKPDSPWNPLGDRGETCPARRLMSYLAVATRASHGWSWNDLYRWTEHLRAEKLTRHAKAKLSEMKGETALAPYAETRQLLGDEACNAGEWGNLEWFEDALKPAKRESFAYPLTIVRKHGAVRLKHHIDHVQGRVGTGLMVGTIHSAKGGEADVVYLWPELSRAGYESYTGPLRDDVLRAMYVGMTRAREELVLCQQESLTAVDWRV